MVMGISLAHDQSECTTYCTYKPGTLICHITQETEYYTKTHLLSSFLDQTGQMQIKFHHMYHSLLMAGSLLHRSLLSQGP